MTGGPTPLLSNAILVPSAETVSLITLPSAIKQDTGRCHRHGPHGDVEVLRPDRVADLAAAPGTCHQARPVENREVLGHGLPGERQLLREGGRGYLAMREEQVQHSAARSVGNGFEQRLLADSPAHSRLAAAARGAKSRHQIFVGAMSAVKLFQHSANNSVTSVS